MSEYGIPYMGSKTGIVKDIIKLFPKAAHFYDVFGGGFSMTHAMLLHRPKDFKTFHYNEIKADIVELVKKAISGYYNYENFKPKFIDKEEFEKTKESDSYIRVCWSFGNNQKNYLFSKEIEPYKKSVHNAVVFNEFDDLAKQVFSFNEFKEGYTITQRRLFLRNKVEYYRIHGIPEFLIPFLNEKMLQQLQRLEQLERLQQLQQLEQLEYSALSYENIAIQPNSIVYCDPPYAGTADYGNSFNTSNFLNWADNQESPVFISEYNISDPRFKIITNIKKRVLLKAGAGGHKVATEKVYVNKSGYKRLLSRS